MEKKTESLFNDAKKVYYSQTPYFSMYHYEIGGRWYVSQSEYTKEHVKRAFPHDQVTNTRMNPDLSTKYNPQKYIYEVGDTKKHYINPHFDLDPKSQIRFTKQDALDRATEFRDYLIEHFPNATKNNIVVLWDEKTKPNADKEYKCSLHVHIVGQKTTMKEFRKWHQYHRVKMDDFGVDANVFRGGITKFRVWGAKKENEKNSSKGFLPLINIDKMKPEDTLIFNTKGSKLIDFNFPKERPANEIKEKPKIKQIFEKLEGETLFSNKKEVKEMLNLIDKNLIKTRNDWLRILGGLYTAFKNKGWDVYEEWAKDSKHYNEHTSQIAWNWAKDKFNVSTIYYLAKQSNEKKYKEIRQKYKKHLNIATKTTNYEIAEFFVRCFGDKFIYKGSLYFWNGFYWKEDANYTIVHHLIAKDLFKKLDKVINEFYSDDGGDQYKKARNNIIKLKDRSFRNQTIEDICSMVTVDFPLNTKWELFLFNNKIYNLKTGQWVEPNKSDYMTLTTGYDYEETPQEYIDELDKLLDTIFTVKSHKRYALTSLSKTLEGCNSEEFIIATGKGGNGKGLINELIHTTLGNYSYVGNNTVLQNDMKSGADPNIANMDFKRFVIFREPSSKRTLNTGTIKELTGGNEVNARLCFSNKTQTTLHCTVICECNNKPKLDEVSEGIYRRLKIIDFQSLFRSNYKEYQKMGFTNVFKKDAKYKSAEFQQSHKLAMFEILRSYYGKEKQYQEPSEFKSSRFSYCLDSDTVGAWIQENYEHTESKTDIVMLSDLYTEFVQSSYFINLTKANKRDLGSLSKFEKFIMLNPVFSVYYHPARSREECFKKAYYELKKEKKDPSKFLTNFKKVKNVIKPETLLIDD